MPHESVLKFQANRHLTELTSDWYQNSWHASTETVLKFKQL